MVCVTTTNVCLSYSGSPSSPWISCVYKRPTYPRSPSVLLGFPPLVSFPWPLRVPLALAAPYCFTVLVILFVALFWTPRVVLFARPFLKMMYRFTSFAYTPPTTTRPEVISFSLLRTTLTLVPPLLSAGTSTLFSTEPGIGVASLPPHLPGILLGLLPLSSGTVVWWTSGVTFTLMLLLTPG